jgi:hypothetical protein
LLYGPKSTAGLALARQSIRYKITNLVLTSMITRTT